MQPQGTKEHALEMSVFFLILKKLGGKVAGRAADYVVVVVVVVRSLFFFSSLDSSKWPRLQRAVSPTSLSRASCE